MRRLVHNSLVGVMVAMAAALLIAQATHITTSGTLPATCRVGDVYYKTGASAGTYNCTATNTWALVAASGAGTVTNTGTLTSNALIAGNGSADIKVATAAASSKLLGSGASGSGSAYSELTLGTNLSMSGTTLNATGSGGSTVSQGVYASLPGTCTTGDVYLFTDAVFELARCSATNTWSYFIRGKQGSPVAPVAGWTGVNTASLWTQADSGGGGHFTIGSSGLNWRGLSKAQPSTPYSVTAFWTGFQSTGNTSGTGLYFYDGTKLMGIELLQGNLFRVEKITNVTTDSGTAASFTGFKGAPDLGAGIWARITNSGANLTFSWSADGVSFTTLFTEAIGTFITPTHYMIGGVQAGSTGVTVYVDFHSVFIS